MNRQASRDATLTWLSELQRRFGDVVCTPLDAGSGALRANLASYAPETCAEVRAGAPPSAQQRLAVYNRQYWFRLFGVLQNELPLTSRLFGAWFFNQYAMRFLRAHPPRHRDLQRVADGFAAFLEAEIAGETLVLEPHAPVLPRAAVLEAARLDAAFSRVFLAPEQPRFAPASRTQRALQRLQLAPSAAYALIEEHWPLVGLRNGLLGTSDEAAVRLPKRLRRAQSWALFRHATGVGQVALEPLHARLLALLEAHPIEVALGQLETECSASERDSLPGLTQRWIAQSVELGFWRGSQP